MVLSRQFRRHSKWNPISSPLDWYFAISGTPWLVSDLVWRSQLLHGNGSLVESNPDSSAWLGFGRFHSSNLQGQQVSTLPFASGHNLDVPLFRRSLCLEERDLGHQCEFLD